MPANDSPSATKSESELYSLAAHKRQTWFLIPESEVHPLAKFVGHAFDIAAGAALALEIIQSAALAREAIRDGETDSFPALNISDSEILMRFALAAIHGLRNEAQFQIKHLNEVE